MKVIRETRLFLRFLENRLGALSEDDFGLKTKKEVLSWNNSSVKIQCIKLSSSTYLTVSFAQTPVRLWGLWLGSSCRKMIE